MKRTNLVLDEQLLKNTVILSGKKTYSDAVNEAMNEYIKIKQFSDIFFFEGSNRWEGNLSEMREDKNIKKGKKVSYVSN